jgi:hypothetical protein
MPRNIIKSRSSCNSRSSSGSSQGPDRTYGPVRSCPMPRNIKSRSSSSSRSSSIRSGLVRCREISRAEAVATVAAAVAVSGPVLSDAAKYQEQKQ